MIINHYTYDQDGQIFVHSIVPIKTPYRGSIAGTVAWKVSTGWQQISDNQVAKVDHLGFLDVITYEEKEQ